MIGALLLFAAFHPQLASPIQETAKPQIRIEKLTPSEIKALDDAKKAVADAEAKLEAAKRALQGTTEGIEQDHHANTECGCYEATVGRDYDKVEFKGDTIVIQHVHEPPVSLH
jgi:hypothetical protein